MAASARDSAGLAESSQARILLCASSTPWGTPNGYRLRLALVAEALSRLGVVDVCVLDTWRSVELDTPWPAWVGDAEWCKVERTRWWPLKVLLGWAPPVPDARLAANAEAAAHARFFSKPYDLTWCVEVRGYEPVADIVSSPVVLDLHNVYSTTVAHKRRAQLANWWRPAAWRETLALPAYFPGVERRWQEWERAAIRRCNRVVVCSELDSARLASPNVVAIPNCYRRPDRPAGDQGSADGPLRVGFVGLLDYQPNLEGLRWFATRVWPRIRALEPDAEFHVIGHSWSRLPTVERQPGVRMLGFVPELAPHLAELSVLVTPLRIGGGTRFKILEAFAHRLPMVSTVVGVEGIEARDGEHLLLRDGPAEFASAVIEAHRNRALRQRLVDAATRLYEARYTWERGLDAVTLLARELLDPAAARDRA
jgi:glycosyltransferase involved in cell wall biosynthesis